MEKVNFTIEEREAANAYIRAQLKRTSEDDYIREEERKIADIRVDQARKEERDKADAQLQKADAQLQKAENDKLDTAKRLLRRGLSVEDVAEDTGLDYSVVCSLV